jgi:hypothetical protein
MRGRTPGLLRSGASETSAGPALSRAIVPEYIVLDDARKTAGDRSPCRALAPRVSRVVVRCTVCYPAWVTGAIRAVTLLAGVLQRDLSEGTFSRPTVCLYITPTGKPPPLAVRLEKALPFRRWVAARASCGGAPCPRPRSNPKHNAESDGQEAHHTMRKSAKRSRGAAYASQPREGCPLLHPLQGASCLSTPLQGGILKPPALRVVDDFLGGKQLRVR